MLLVVVFAVVVLLWWFVAARRRSAVPVARLGIDRPPLPDTGSAARLRELQADLAEELGRRGVRDPEPTDFLAVGADRAAVAARYAESEPVAPRHDRPGKAAHRRYHAQHGAHDPLDTLSPLSALTPLRPRAALRPLDPSAALAARKPLPSHQPGG